MISGCCQLFSRVFSSRLAAPNYDIYTPTRQAPDRRKQLSTLLVVCIMVSACLLGVEPLRTTHKTPMTYRSPLHLVGLLVYCYATEHERYRGTCDNDSHPPRKKNRRRWATSHLCLTKTRKLLKLVNI